jgi:hypothetical protein
MMQFDKASVLILGRTSKHQPFGSPNQVYVFKDDRTGLATLRSRMRTGMRASE